MGRSLAPVYLVCLLVMAIALWPRGLASPGASPGASSHASPSGVVRVAEAERPAVEYRVQVEVAPEAPAGLWMEFLDEGGRTLPIHDPAVPAAGGRERVALGSGTNPVRAVRRRPASLCVRLGDAPDAPVHHEEVLDASAGALTGVRVP